MRIVYQRVKSLLQPTTEIVMTDLDKGQLDNFSTRPPVAFPCALIKISIDRTEDIGGGLQLCQCTVNVKLGFDFSGDTDSLVSDVVLDDSLAYFDVQEKVFVAIHGKKNSEVGAFNRTKQFQETRSDGLTVVNIAFATTFYDKSAIAP